MSRRTTMSPSSRRHCARSASRCAGSPVKDMSIGMMLDGLFNITRDFDMQTQPHLLLLQKTMVMVEGVATSLDPDINLWDSAAPFVREWIRTELGPEAAVADRLITDLRTLAPPARPDPQHRAALPAPGGAPPAPPLKEIEVVRIGGGWRYAAVAIVASAAVAVAATWLVLEDAAAPTQSGHSTPLSVFFFFFLNSESG